MKAMKGVILLEVLISIMISSMIFMSLMAAMFQLSKARITVDDSIDVHTRVSTIFDLMHQDFDGTTIPVQAELPAEKTQKQSPEAQPKKETPTEEKKTAESSDQQPEKKEKEKPIKNLFYGTFKNNNSDMVSCITNNPTAIYWSERAGKAKPRVVRIVYTLVPDPEHKESFLLKRQESTELDLDAYKKPENPAARAYEVAEGIKEFKISYLYLEKKEEAPQASAAQKDDTPKEAPKDTATKKATPEKPDYKTKPDWENNKEKESENSKNKEPLLPSFMVVSLTMFNSTYKKEYPFEFVIALHANEAQQIKQARMRYKEAETKPTGAQNPAGDAPSEQPQTEHASPSDSQESIELVALNREPAQTVAQRTPGTPITTHDLLVDNIVQKNIEQFYEKIIKEERGETSQSNNNNENSESLNNDESDPEQVDMPEGKIDIVHDEDTNTTHIVYQGPLIITPEMLQGIS